MVESIQDFGTIWFIHVLLVLYYYPYYVERKELFDVVHHCQIFSQISTNGTELSIVNTLI